MDGKVKYRPLSEAPSMLISRGRCFGKALDEIYETRHRLDSFMTAMVILNKYGIISDIELVNAMKKDYEFWLKQNKLK